MPWCHNSVSRNWSYQYAHTKKLVKQKKKKRKLCKYSHWGISYIKSACLQRLLGSPHKEQGSSSRTDARKDKGILYENFTCRIQCRVSYHLHIYIYPSLCDPTDYSPPGSSVLGILQARILEWVAIPFSRGSSWARDQTQVSCIAGRFFSIWAIIEMHFF